MTPEDMYRREPTEWQTVTELASHLGLTAQGVEYRRTRGTVVDGSIIVRRETRRSDGRSTHWVYRLTPEEATPGLASAERLDALQAKIRELQLENEQLQESVHFLHTLLKRGGGHG